MRLSRYAFIARAPGFSPDRHRTELTSSEFAMTVVGVESVEQAEAVARILVGEGVQLIELCGGFDEAAADRVSAAVGGSVPVGVATFRGEARNRHRPGTT